MTDTGFWFIIGVLVGWFASLFVDKNFLKGDEYDFRMLVLSWDIYWFSMGVV